MHTCLIVCISVLASIRQVQYLNFFQEQHRVNKRVAEEPTLLTTFLQEMTRVGTRSGVGTNQLTVVGHQAFRNLDRHTHNRHRNDQLLHIQQTRSGVGTNQLTVVGHQAFRNLDRHTHNRHRNDQLLHIQQREKGPAFTHTTEREMISFYTYNRQRNDQFSHIQQRNDQHSHI